MISRDPAVANGIKGPAGADGRGYSGISSTNGGLFDAYMLPTTLNVTNSGAFAAGDYVKISYLAVNYVFATISSVTTDTSIDVVYDYATMVLPSGMVFPPSLDIALAGLVGPTGPTGNRYYAELSNNISVLPIGSVVAGEWSFAPNEATGQTSYPYLVGQRALVLLNNNNYMVGNINWVDGYPASTFDFEVTQSVGTAGPSTGWTMDLWTEGPTGTIPFTISSSLPSGGSDGDLWMVYS